MAVVDDLGHSGMDVPPPTEDFGRQPPQDEAAEQAVLGGMLLSKDAIADVLERLRPGDFYRPAHQNVYDAILDLYGRGEPADAVTVAAELDRRGLLRRIGGAPYLHTLISTVPTAANAGFYAGIVAEKALLRTARRGWHPGRAVRLRRRGGRRCGRDRGPRAGRDLRRHRGAHVGGLRRAGRPAAADDGRDRRDRIQRRSGAWCADRVHRARRGDQRPASGSDDHCRGEAGCREKRRWDWIFCGRARSSTGLASVIFSLEMSKSEIVMRLLSAEAKIKLADMRSGRMSDDDWTRLARRMSEISEAPLFIDDSPNLTMMEIRAKARRLKQKADLRLIVVDYMQLMTFGQEVRVAPAGSLGILAQPQAAGQGARRPGRRDQPAEPRPRTAHRQEADDLGSSRVGLPDGEHADPAGRQRR